MVLCVVAAAGQAGAEDWPAYRHDPARSACSEQKLTDVLHLQWVRRLPRREAMFTEDIRNCPDYGYEPVVLGGTLFVGTEHDDALLAIDAASGAEKWRFYAEGPIRLAPVAWEGKVAFGADDGYVYCLSAADGKLLWRYDGAPSRRKVVNHGRVGSNWPVSGSPLPGGDGTICFTSGVWATDGVIFHVLDAASGRCILKKPVFDIVTMGYTSRAGDWIAVSSGINTPSFFNVKTARHYPGGGQDVKNQMPCETAALKDASFLVGNRTYAVREQPGPSCWTYVNAEHETRIWLPVIDGDRLYGFNDGIFRALRLAAPGGKRTKSGLDEIGGPWWINARPDYRWSKDDGEELPLPKGTELPKDFYPRRLFIRAGRRLYAGGHGAVLAMEVPTAGKKPAVTWAAKVDGHVTSVVAADDRLFVVTEPGRVYCFGAGKVEPASYDLPGPPPAAGDQAGEQVAKLADAILNRTGVTDGYCVVWGLADGRLAEQLARRSALRVVGIDADAAKVDSLRRQFGQHGLLSPALDLRAAEAGSEVPPYLASLIVTETPGAQALAGPADLGRMFAALRPYGGTICLSLSDGQHKQLAVAVSSAKLPNTVVRRDGQFSLVIRQGALPGAGQWTHERCDAGNTLASTDTAVRLPLGLLWFGGPAANFRLQGGHDLAHAQEVVEGRYILVGDGILRAVDVYTGRLIWRVDLPKIQQLPRVSPRDVPEPPAGVIPAWHICRTRGPNTTAMPDLTYCCMGTYLLELLTARGEEVRRLDVPFRDDLAKVLCWGRVRCTDDTIVATAFDPQDLKDTYGGWYGNNERCKDKLMMRWLFALDRPSGKLLWKRRAQNAFINNGVAVGGGRVYVTDMYLSAMLAGLEQSGRRVTFTQPTVYGLDLRTGRQLWATPQDVEAPKIVYSAPRDTLVLGYRNCAVYEGGKWVARPLPPPPGSPRNAKPAPPDVMIAYQGATGRQLWRVTGGEYPEPLQVNGDTVISHYGHVYDLATGQPRRRLCAVTGKPIGWFMPSALCSYEIGSPTFCTRQSGVDDLATSLHFFINGIRPGCVPSMVPADGVLSDLPWRGYCPSQSYRTAVALTHRPEGATWGSYATDAEPGPIRRLALNLAAPGDTACEERIWVAQGIPAGPARHVLGRELLPPLYSASVEPNGVTTFADHPCTVHAAAPGALPAVAASGFEGLTELVVSWKPQASPAAPAAPARGKHKAPAGAKEPPKAAAPPALAYPRIRYTVRLHFVEPDLAAVPGRRVFGIALQGKDVLGELDVVKEAGGPRRAIVRQFRGIPAADTLTVTLKPKAGLPVLCGIEIVAE